MQTVCASGMDRQMKGEYFKMKNHGLHRIFSLFLALFMVFTLLPTAALAEDTTDQQPVVVEDQQDKGKQEQREGEDPPAPEGPKTFTVTYTDGANGAVFPNQVSNLPSGAATPAFNGTPERKGYTFAGWNPAVAGTVTADVTYVAQWEEKRVTVPTIPGPDPAPAALNTDHKIDVTFTVLYVSDEFNLGYNYGSSEKTKFVCQYSSNHSDTAYNNHTIAISDIKAAAGRASVNSGYQIVGWSKESNANPTTWSLNKSGTTACNKGTTIYLVAKNPNPTTKYTYTLNYDANGGTGAPSADSWSTTDASIRYHSFTVKNTIPTREGYVFKGWKAKDGSDTIYTGGTLCSVSQQGNDVVKNGNTWTRTLYAVWEKAVPSKPQWSDIRGEMQKVSVHVTCSNPDVNHTEKTYSYKESNDDTIGSVQDSAGSYTCTVTVHLGRYRLQYNQDFNREHEFASSLTADVVLQYNGTGWVIASALPLELKLTCGSAPTPNPPGSDVLNSLKVLVKCDSKTYHFEKPYKMDDGDYRLEKVDDNTYTVIVLADKYVEKYNAVYPGHTLFDNNTKTIKLVYRYGAWTVVGSNGVTFNVSCEQKYTVTYTDGVDGEAFADQAYTAKYEDATPAFEGTPARKGFVFDGWTPEVAETVTDNATYTAQWKPVQPDKKAIEGAIGRGVAVVCDNQNVNHGEKKYKPTLGEYTVSNVMGTAADGYTCTVTVRAAKFIEKYSSDMSDAVHTLIAGEPAEKTIELKWNGEKWVAETELPVTFHTLCPPEQPSKKDIEGAIGRGVKIVCDNQNVKHGGKDYKPTQGEYTVSDVTGTASEGYTCTITVKAAKIIEKYSSDMGKAHALIVGEQAEKTVELKWDGEKWVAKTELPITFHVECPPEKPTYDELKGLGINAKVDCTTTTAHNDKSYTLIEDTYNVSDPERKGTAYTCILTVNAKDYVARYNAEENVGPHTLDDRDSKTIELTWNGEKWTAAETRVTFNVKCELLTVTYTDGVKGEEVFADVVYKDIPYGTSTPAFGTKDPTREGYKFVGWEPEVAETVTKNVTDTAKWEKLYPVTYTDGAKGKAFKDQVYSDLEAGTDTPKFDGKPTRKGYTFTGWSPKVTDTVTKDVTYVAQWKSVKNGKDNIPKTGDSEIVMVLGSVLLFSFCGAAAVSVYDRKRKHF